VAGSCELKWDILAVHLTDRPNRLQLRFEVFGEAVLLARALHHADRVLAGDGLGVDCRDDRFRVGVWRQGRCHRL